MPRLCLGGRAILALTASSILLLVGCSRRLVFDHLRQADRIEVRANAEVLRTTADPETVHHARAFIVARADGWRQNWAGTPIPVFVIYFYSGNRAVGGYGVGADFLTNDPGGGSLSRSAVATECEDLAAALGVSLQRR